MGLFKRFRNIFLRSTPTEEMDKVRMFEAKNQHYVFVHQVLRDLFFDSPDKIIAILRDEGRNNSLLDLWNKVGDVVGESRLVEPNGLCCETKIYDGVTIAIITLPTPKTLNEAYLVALLHRNPPPRQEALTRFVALEHSVDTVVLCEWDGTGRHVNMGYQCEPILQEFFEAVCRIL